MIKKITNKFLTYINKPSFGKELLKNIALKTHNYGKYKIVNNKYIKNNSYLRNDKYNFYSKSDKF